MSQKRPSRIAIAGALGVLLLASAAPGHAVSFEDAGVDDELWVDRYDPGPDRNAAGLEPFVAPDGSTLYAVGVVTSYEATFYRVVAFDPATGRQQWAVERLGAVNAAALSSDGSRIYLAGFTRTDDVTYQDWLVVALDASSGEQIWTTTYEQPGRRDLPNDIAVSPDGTRVHVAGRSRELKRRSQDFTVLTLDSVTGDEMWADLHDGPDGRYDEAFGVAVDPGGERLYVTGMVAVGDTETFGHPDTDYATIAYDAATGRRHWFTGFGGPGRKYSSDIPVAVVADDSAVYVTGQSTGPRDDPDWFTAGLEARFGGELWTARYNRARGSEDAPYSMALSPSGDRVYVTGASAVRQFDGVTIAYRTLNGSPDWTARFGRRGGTDFGWDVAASPDGERVYVTGVIFDPASLVQDFVTLGYSERDGSEEWSATYGGGDADDLPTVAVQPDSARVFLVGREWDDGDIIFETVAYEPPR